MNIRPATIDDYEQLCGLFDEVDRLHREAQPDVFRKPDGLVRSRERISHVVDGTDPTILVGSATAGCWGLPSCWRSLPHRIRFALPSGWSRSAASWCAPTDAGRGPDDR